MDLPIELVKEFAKTTNDETIINEGATVYGRYILQNDNAFVEIDGSDGTLTPVATTSTAKNGDRVTVLIKDHTAIVTGNLTDPSASSDKVEEVEKSVSFLDSGLEGVKETIEDLDSTVTDLDNIVDTVNWKYKDAEGNIITLTGKIDDVIKQANNAADDASKVATNYIKFFDGTGLVIGNNIGTIAEANIGFNTMIDSTSFNIRYGKTILASYEASTIYLGRYNDEAIIDLCNGLCSIRSVPFSTGSKQWGRLFMSSEYPIYIGIDYDTDPETGVYPSIEIIPSNYNSETFNDIDIYSQRVHVTGVVYINSSLYIRDGLYYNGVIEASATSTKKRVVCMGTDSNRLYYVDLDTAIDQINGSGGVAVFG